MRSHSAPPPKGGSRSSRLWPTGPSAGLLNRRYVVTVPVGFWIADVAAVSAITWRPVSSQIRPVSS